MANNTDKTINITKYVDELVSDIKDKKELRTLDEDFVRQKLEIFLDNKNHDKHKSQILEKISDSKNYKQFTKSKEYKSLVTEVRAELRKVYGVFIMEGYDKRKKILKQLIGEKDSFQILELHKKLFALHKSTKERMSHYEELYSKIFGTISKFGEKSSKFIFMDLACGLNPLSNIYFKDKIKKYYISDISTEDCEFLKEYFKSTDIDVDIFPADLTDERVFSKLSKIKVDICFIFKTLDGLERVKRNITSDLMKSIDAKYFAVTFPTLSIGGVREIKEHRRLWFERLLERLGWKFEKFLLESELLYIIEKG